MERKELELLAKEISSGNRLALSKGLTIVENKRKEGEILVSYSMKHMHESFVIGVTGSPGTGKSTLINKLVREYRNQKKRVGVVAVDPSSHITGGAFLGDRIRMTSHSKDEGVFIRSMASRGWKGGLSSSTAKAVQLMSSAGYEIIFVETVGAGQLDVDVSNIANMVIVVTMPGSGDQIQMLKAGLLEIGDIFVVNKSDLGGSDAFAGMLISMLRDMGKDSASVYLVSCTKEEGIGELYSGIEKLRARLFNEVEIKEKMISSLIREVARERIYSKLEERLSRVDIQRISQEIIRGKRSLLSVIDEIAS